MEMSASDQKRLMAILSDAPPDAVARFTVDARLQIDGSDREGLFRTLAQVHTGKPEWEAGVPNADVAAKAQVNVAAARDFTLVFDCLQDGKWRFVTVFEPSR